MRIPHIDYQIKKEAMAVRGKKKGAHIHASLSERIAPAVFLAPAGILMAMISIVPIGYSLYISFLKYNLAKPVSTVRYYAFNNYIKMLTNPQFLDSVVWTLVFALVSLVIEVLLGMILAVMLNSEQTKKYNAPFKTFLIIPMMIAPVVSATIWKLMFYPAYGVINCTLGLFGYPAVNWLGDAFWAKVAIICVEVWSATPFCVLVFQAALKTVSTEMLEAATVDGASAWRTYFSITLPTIRNFVALVVTVRLSNALRAFDAIMQLTNGAPGVSTETIGTTIYKTAFRYNDVGQGSAGAFIFFIIVSVVALVSMKIMRRQDA
jgi:multiple sugar transport system permease protein